MFREAITAGVSPSFGDTHISSKAEEKDLGKKEILSRTSSESRIKKLRGSVKERMIPSRAETGGFY